MKPEDLFEHMSAIDDEILERSERNRKTGSLGRDRRTILKRCLAVAAAIAVIGGVALLFHSGIFRDRKPGGGNATDSTITTGSAEDTLAKFRIGDAEIPETAKYPNIRSYDSWNDFVKAENEWCDAVKEQQMQYLIQYTNADREQADSGVKKFTEKSLVALLQGESGTNRICSPLNLYLALGMLAETTTGETREQILTVLGEKSIEAVRKMSDTAWNTAYADDGINHSLLAAALWLRDDPDTEYVPETVELLASMYHASTFRGKMGSDAYNKALQTWLNKNTGDLLKGAAAKQTFDTATMLALTTTVYYKTKWQLEYEASKTSPDKFHAAGGDVTVDFMHKTENAEYYYGDNFIAVSDGFDEQGDNGAFGDMIFFLPDEGVSTEELLSDPQFMSVLLHGKGELVTVRFSVPKFSVDSEAELSDNLRSLGMTDVFTIGKADFSGISKDSDGLYLSKVDHCVHVEIDEKGVKAAAFTDMTVAAGMPLLLGDELDFVLDRPFIFAVRSESGMPLFVGIVENP